LKSFLFTFFVFTMSSSSYYQQPWSYIQISDFATTGEDVEIDEPRTSSETAAQSLLQLHLQSSSRVSLAPSVVSSHIQLNPIQKHPQQKQLCQLPSLSNLLLPHNIDVDRRQSWNSAKGGFSANILYTPSDSSGTYSVNPQQQQTRQLIPPLSTSSSHSSLRSVALNHSKGNISFLSRAATLASPRRRGRPPTRKNTSTFINTTGAPESKIVDMSSSYGSTSSSSGMNVATTNETRTNDTASSPTTAMNKPRWQEAERLELLEAIVKEKNLDDMTSIRWDLISLAVGRAKKACKDQWRRELLPNLMRRFKGASNADGSALGGSSSNSATKKKGNTFVNSGGIVY
jgi:hypothetical protein